MDNYNILNDVNSPSDILKLSMSELNVLALEIRHFLVENISKTGGHLASNLGTVELTLALHKVFSTPFDKIIWDVGHQSYTHKIITGRKNKFSSLRKLGGISGFPKTSESEHDCFNTGHSSTSISAALGFAKAAQIGGENHCSVAIIGDGALTGGMSFEALNHVGSSQTPLIVVLNDNGMSIVKNVGGIAKYLTKIRNNPLYFNLKRDLKMLLEKSPTLGYSLKRVVHTGKKKLKNLLIYSGIFENLGLTYLGPVDGHDIEAMSIIFQYAKEIKSPVLIHVLTKKGHGYKFAEDSPDIFHGISEFNPKTGESVVKNVTYAQILGNNLCEMAMENKKIVAITAAMPSGTGLVEFGKIFSKRFFDVGIAEAHAVTFAAGLAKGGMIPVVAIYSSFLQRAYDQILHDVCMQNLQVVFAIDRAGISGADGQTHQGIYDLSYLMHMPNINIFAPSDYSNFQAVLQYAINNCKAPVAIRYPRLADNLEVQKVIEASTQNGKFYKIFGCAVGCEVLIISVGPMLTEAVNVLQILKSKNIKVTIIDMISIKPLCTEVLVKYSQRSKIIAVLEDNVIIGGIGAAVESLLMKKVNKFGLPDEPIVHGTVEEIRALYGLDAKSIADELIAKINDIRTSGRVNLISG